MKTNFQITMTFSPGLHTTSIRGSNHPQLLIMQYVQFKACCFILTSLSGCTAEVRLASGKYQPASCFSVTADATQTASDSSGTVPSYPNPAHNHAAYPTDSESASNAAGAAPTTCKSRATGSSAARTSCPRFWATGSGGISRYMGGNQGE